MTTLRLAAQYLRDEWSVRPRTTILIVAVIPALIAVLYAYANQNWLLLLDFAVMYWWGWHAQTQWLRNGKVMLVTLDWKCQRCGELGRSGNPEQARVAMAEHLRSVHGEEVTPDEL